MRRRVAPSILAADFGRLREQVKEVIDAGAEVIHVDGGAHEMGMDLQPGPDAEPE